MSDSDTENHAGTGCIRAHPKAARGTAPGPKGVSVPAVMTLSVALGFVVGFMVSVFVAPALGIAFGIGGAMSFGAGAVMVFMFKGSDAHPHENAQTEYEVRNE